MFLNVGANTRKKQIPIKGKFKLPAGTGGETETKSFFFMKTKNIFIIGLIFNNVVIF